jgi:hypothetical protein
MKAKKVITLVDGMATQSTGEIIGVWTGFRTIQGSISGVGALSATVEIYGSNLERIETGILLAILTLSGSTNDNAGDIINAEYAFMWAKITEISGLNAEVIVTVSV